MPTYFVRTDGSNSNNGRDAWGLALASALYDDTGHPDGDYRLDSVTGTPFAPLAAGDLLYLADGGSGLIVPNLYTVASVVSSTVLLLTASAGADTNDVTTSNGPWQTLGHALSTATASGDQVRICANATHSPAAQLSFSSTAGDTANPFRWRGASARGRTDGTRATISASALSSSTDLIVPNINSLGLRFEDLVFTGGGGGRTLIAPGGAAWQLQFLRCRFTAAVNAGSGIGGAGSTSGTGILVECEIDHCAGAGVASTGATHNIWHLLRCRVHHNGGNGVVLAPQPPFDAAIQDCLVYRNGGDGVRILTGGGRSRVTVRGLVSAHNTGDGLDVSTSFPALVENSVFLSNGGYGVNLNASAARLWSLANCCFHGNTSGATDLASIPGTGHVTADPLFVSTADGAEDFDTQASSPLRGAGIQCEER